MPDERMPLEEREQGPARVREDVREVGVALEDAGVDHARRRGGGLVGEADAQRQLEFLHALGVLGEHGVLEHRQPQLVEALPHRLHARVVHRHAGDSRADHHAGEVAETPRVLARAAGALVLTPQPLGGVTQKGVDVLGELDVLERAAHLQNRAALLLEGSINWHPDHLHEEVRRQMGREVQPSAAIIDSQSVKTTEKGGFTVTTVRRRLAGENGTFWWIRRGF